MLDEFIRSHRDVIIARARARVASRQAPRPSAGELKDGIPAFLDQLGAALRRAASGDSVDHAAMNASADRHGHDLLKMGLTIAQVVHDYGDVCQTVTELAVEQAVPIPPGEFQTLNLCLDDAIAQAVTAFAADRERAIESRGSERLGVLAHELRNLLATATLSFESIQSGRVSAAGSTGQVHARSLVGLGNLIDRSLADVRLDAGIEHLERITACQLLEEVEIAAFPQARARGLTLTVACDDRTLAFDGDRQTLAAALANLLQNAFKFTRKPGAVSLTTRATDAQVLFEVEDECGGLPAGTAEDMFRPFEQRGADRSGLGLGLTICRKAARAHGGELSVRDLPGHGCVFTLALPRPAAPSI